MGLMGHLQDLYNISISKEKKVLEDLNSKRFVILKNKERKGNDSAGSHWFAIMTEYINVLLSVQKSTGAKVLDEMQKDVNSKNTELAIRSILLALVLVLTPLMIIAVIRMTNTIQKYAAQLETVTLNLQEEQKRTDSVLSAMFPQSVAESLKKGEKVNSEYFDSVTVFFSDIVNFTNICAMISPMEVTSMLNGIYSAFDDTIDKYDVYKVETIGDAYMVVSGLPIRNEDNHVDQICHMAIDLVQVTRDFDLAEVPGEVLVIRVGIHTAQKIHISESTFQILTCFQGYETEFRGHIPVKGKGEMQTYWLINGCWSPNKAGALKGVGCSEDISTERDGGPLVP
ncbi:hypothetical protein QZH41_004317 [Actinostola sp. cb2023]|nr:hypothetical protein QZH41_004317 [Actinostola sp. cb2023]